MAIIAFSRQLVSLGDEIAADLAKTLGYRYVDKLVIDERLGEAGLVKGKLEKYDEKKPGFWASLSQDRDDYFHWLKTIMYDEAAKGDTVFIGRAAFRLFSCVPGTLLVRVVAAESVRLERAMKLFNCEEEHARKIIAKSDSDRAGFHRYFFNIDWNDPEQFHIVINSGLFSTAEIVDTIGTLVRRIINPEINDACSKKIAEFNLAQSTSTEILYRKKIPIHFLEVEAEARAVRLNGVANSQGAIEAAIMAAKVVPGVETVTSNIQIIQDYSVMP